MPSLKRAIVKLEGECSRQVSYAQYDIRPMRDRTRRTIIRLLRRAVHIVTGKQKVLKDRHDWSYDTRWLITTTHSNADAP